MEHTQIHLFMFCLWLLSCYSGSAERLPEKTLWPTEPNIFTIWPFTYKLCQALLKLDSGGDPNTILPSKIRKIFLFGHKGGKWLNIWERKWISVKIGTQMFYRIISRYQKIKCHLVQPAFYLMLYFQFFLNSKRSSQLQLNWSHQD